MSARRPLEGIRVVEAGIALAGPFAGSMLAELGAHVVKVERPGGGDPMRLMGPSVGDVTVWWGVAARAKLCVDLDFKKEEEKEVFRRLVRDADILVENYRPGVMDRLGIGWEALRKVNPKLIMLSISGFGQTGPDSGRPGFGKIAEALSGIVSLTGKAEEVPMHIGFSLADTSTGLMGTLGVALALYQRDLAGGKGARIDLALYEPLLRMTECQLALFERLGRPPLREGTNDPYGWGASGQAAAQVALKCADGEWIMAARASLPAKAADEVAKLGRDAALERLRKLGVPAVPVHDGASLAKSPYFTERRDVVRTTDPQIGDLTVPGEVPKTYREPALPLFRPVRPNEDRSKVL
jgi:crotonobetainyl-CoA:carnitine CoA-transferase CaiB-like acyl-CoA transferase